MLKKKEKKKKLSLFFTLLNFSTRTHTHGSPLGSDDDVSGASGVSVARTPMRRFVRTLGRLRQQTGLYFYSSWPGVWHLAGPVAVPQRI